MLITDFLFDQVFNKAVLRGTMHGSQGTEVDWRNNRSTGGRRMMLITDVYLPFLLINSLLICLFYYSGCILHSLDNNI